MIKGLTHDASSGVISKIVKYKGKISTGYAPNEGPNKTNYPQAAGFFRVLKEVMKTIKKTGKDDVIIKKWVLDEVAQKKLEEVTGSKTPRKIEFICLFQNPDQLWESCLAQYSSSEGLICRSHGEGEEASYLQFDSKGEREWIKRSFDGISGCPYQKCPDYKSKICKEIGLMKMFPLVSLNTQPYRFETRSINTIRGVESQIDDMWNLLKAAHMVKCREANSELDFQGFFGAKLALVHRKIKSGGRDVYITDIVPSKEFSDSLMAPIGRGIKMNQTAALTADSNDGIAMLGADIKTGQKQIQQPLSDISIEDEKNIAKDFHSDADNPKDEVVNQLDDAAKALIKEGK